MKLAQLDVSLLHYYEPDRDHQDGVTLCKSCATCLLGMDVAFDGLRFAESCASCGELQNHEPWHSIEKAMVATDDAIGTCRTAEDIEVAARSIREHLSQSIEKWATMSSSLPRVHMGTAKD